MKTARVRIMVVVAKDGSYGAGGNGEKGEHYSERDLEWVYDALPNHVKDGEFHKVWVEADVPLPDAPTVEGKVVPDVFYMVRTEAGMERMCSTEKQAIESALETHTRDGYKYSVWVSTFKLDGGDGEEIGMFRRNPLGPRKESAWIPYDHEDWVPEA